MPPKPSLSPYLEAVFQTHCPYLGPAVEHDLLRSVDYTGLEALATADVAALGLLNAEKLRLQRRAAAPRARRLMCSILCLPDRSHTRHALGQTHFLLKRLFTCKGLLFGKFHPGQGLVGTNGQPVPDPPQPILVIRSSLPRQDLRFFEQKSRPFRDDYLTASDDGALVGSPALRWSAEQMRGALDQPPAPARDLDLARAAYAPDALLTMMETDNDRARHRHAAAS